MAILAPKPTVIIDYKTYFGVPPPEDRISFIKDISKKNVLYEITALNYRLKPKEKIHIDISLNTQLKELKYFTQSKELFQKYFKTLKGLIKSEKDYPIIFNRQCCLFAIEEIINSDGIEDIEDFEMARIEVWEAILKYLLAVNYAITEIRTEDKEDRIGFEYLNPKLLPLNELMIETDLIYTPYRGYWLFAFFLKHDKYKEEINKFFKAKYGIEPNKFIYEVLSLYMSNNNENPEHNFFYLVEEGSQDLFDKLSIEVFNTEMHKLISIRKSPFIKVGKHKFLISDNSFLLEKTYNQFINDFWFDWIKLIKNEAGKLVFNIHEYRSAFGYFFEEYIAGILANSFEKYNYSHLSMFDDLKIKSSDGEIEITDIYFRNTNKIILGQVKSGSIYDKEKFGGSVESLYKNNRDKFFENFGVDQLIESLNKMDKYIQEVDIKFPKGHVYKVFPVIIVNDKVFQTPLMADIFNTRFKELLPSFKVKNAIVYPLSLIHVSDLERLETFLNEKPKEIWEILKYNHRNKKFIPPFYFTVNQKIKGRKYPKRVTKLFKELITLYGPNKN